MSDAMTHSNEEPRQGAGREATSRDVARALLERFFDSEEPVPVADLLAECPPDQREHVKLVLATLDAIARYEEEVPPLPESDVARSMRRISWLHRREAIRTLWSTPPAAEVRQQTEAALRRLWREGTGSVALSRNPAQVMARYLGVTSEALQFNRTTEGGPSSAGPDDEPTVEKERWIGEEAEALLKKADALYTPFRREHRKLEQYLALVAAEVEVADGGLEGCLVTDGKVGGIVVNSAVPYAPRRSFTLAHEIGHFILHRSLAGSAVGGCFNDGAANLHNFRGGIELEANLFASALLMPPSVLRRHYTNPSLAPRIAQVNSLMAACEVSALAAMCRLVRATERPCVLIVFKDGYVDWHLSSDAFEGEALEKGDAIPSSSTADLYARTVGDAQDKYFAPGTPAEWWLRLGAYSSADESTFKVNGRYIYSMLTFR